MQLHETEEDRDKVKSQLQQTSSELEEHKGIWMGGGGGGGGGVEGRRGAKREGGGRRRCYRIPTLAYVYR